MRRAPWVMLAWLAATPVAAWGAESLSVTLRHSGVSSTQARRLTHEARADGVPSRTVRGWARRFAELRRENLPVSLAVEQVFEGLMKGVAPARISSALRMFEADLRKARRALDRHATADSLHAHPRARRRVLSDLVIASRAGIRGRSLDRLLGSGRLPVAQVAIYAQVAADLRGWGVGRGRVVRLLAHARKAGVSDKKLFALDAKLGQQAALGRGPRALGREMSEGLGLRSSGGMGAGFGGGGPQGLSGPTGTMGGPGGGLGGPAGAGSAAGVPGGMGAGSMGHP